MAFAARRCVSAVYAVVVYQCVHPIASWYCIETTGLIKLIFILEASIYLSYMM